MTRDPVAPTLEEIEHDDDTKGWYLVLGDEVLDWDLVTDLMALRSRDGDAFEHVWELVLILSERGAPLDRAEA